MIEVYKVWTKNIEQGILNKEWEPNTKPITPNP